MVSATLGTQTAGSVIRPASFCGVVGFKPTFDLVPLAGCFPLAPSLDHAGPMARTVEECTRMLEAMVPGLERMTLGSLEEVEVGIADDLTDRAVAAITNAAKTGQIGDGKIFITDLNRAVRIRTGETDNDAL